MTVVAYLTTPNSDSAPDCAPRRIVSQLPSIEIEVVQFRQTGTGAIPYFWVWGVPQDEFETVLTADPQISGVQQLARPDRGALYKAVWEVDSPMIHCMDDTNNVIMGAHGTADKWRLKIWFEDGTHASAFQECCHAENIPLRIDRLLSLSEVLSKGQIAVSDRQHEAMALAYREGYFDEPRRTTQEELADKLGISSSAVGRRLRRGFRGLIDETLLE